jgi:hypothetical protein
MNARWQPPQPAIKGEAELQEAVLAVHQALYREQLSQDPLCNGNLPIELRACRTLEQWQLMLLLTPWMLARLLLPTHPPKLELPGGWSAEERQEADYLVLGPRLDFQLLDQPRQAHLNHHPRLGHYLLQPLILNMAGFDSADAVFEAWNRVIRTRDENMEKIRRDCPWQKDVSRRELFRGLRGNA